MAATLRALRAEDSDEPIETYMKEVNSGTSNVHPYERLMIWYRKSKLYKEELDVINKGIARLKKLYADQQKQTLGKKINPSIKALSASISKTTGLHDKKGNEVFLPDPLPKWIKRKHTVEQKIGKQNTPPKKKKKKKGS